MSGPAVIGLCEDDDDAPDVLVLDIGLPDADGRDVCQALRAQGVIAPVLFLIARDALSDLISAGGRPGGAAADRHALDSDAWILSGRSLAERPHDVAARLDRFAVQLAAWGQRQPAGRQTLTRWAHAVRCRHAQSRRVGARHGHDLAVSFATRRVVKLWRLPAPGRYSLGHTGILR